MFHNWNLIVYLYLCFTAGVRTHDGPSGRRDAHEPLLRFPFVRYLANPCGIGSRNPSGWAIHEASNLNETDDNLTQLAVLPGAQSLLELSRRFVTGFQDRYPDRSNITDVERQDVDRELHLVFRQIRNLIDQIYSTTAIPNCQGMQLQSLGSAAPVVTSSGTIRGMQLYRQLLIATAHLHLMVRDIIDSGRYCLHESFIQRQLIHQLTGKLESMMCLIIQSGSSSTSRFFSVTASVLPMTVYRNHDCSFRQVRSCLVLNYTSRIFDSIDRIFANSQQIDSADKLQYQFVTN